MLNTAVKLRCSRASTN